MPPIKTVAVVPISRGGGRKTPSPARGERAESPSPAVAVPARAPGVAHRYRVGERLRMTHGGNTLARTASFCKVIALLPYEGYGALMYRVRSETEQFERVLAEADLSRNVLEP